LKYEETKFLAMYHKIGGSWRIIKSQDFQISLILGLTFAVIVGCYNKEILVIKTICPIFITLSATMIIVAIAGLAIIVSMSDPTFVKILKEADVYNNILFFFRYSTFISCLSIISNIFTYITPLFLDVFAILFLLLLISSILLFYSLFSVIFLVGTIMRYGLYRGAFITRE